MPSFGCISITSGISVLRFQIARPSNGISASTQAIRNLVRDERFEPELARALEPLPGFRNVLVHDYVGLDLDRVVEAMSSLEPVESFYSVVHQIIADS